MKIYQLINKNLFNLFLLFYFFIAISASLKTGITHDERFDLHNYQLNKNIISNFFLNTDLNTEYLYGEKAFMTAFYGIGFHLLSFPFEQILNFLDLDFDLTNEGRLQILKHPSIIILFIISGIYFKKLIYLTTASKNFSTLASIFYLMYPYIIGHSFFNIKDSPFMSVWLICTFFIATIVKDFLFKEKIRLKKIVILGCLTSILISIRIVGFLILLEYLIFLIILLSNTNIDIKSFLKKTFKPIIIFLLTLIISVYILHPHFWKNPETLFYALDFFKNHVQTVCTITLGTCMKAQDLPSSYLPIWFFFKLPIIVILGLLLFPFTDKKIFKKKINVLIIGSLISTILLILSLLILTKAIIYDELRHVLFLIPLILIISFTALSNFFSKKNLFTFFLIYIFFFSFQNIKIFPYNYLWLNNMSSFLKVSGNFELDYWGASTRNVASFFKNKHIDSKRCIISNRNDGLGYYLKNNFHTCYIPFKNLEKKNQRPFYVALMERKLTKGLPDRCQEIHSEKINLNFSRENIVLAKVFECN